ncbi:hypothetical protein D3C72_2120460 [compost metagenome]
MQLVEQQAFDFILDAHHHRDRPGFSQLIAQFAHQADVIFGQLGALRQRLADGAAHMVGFGKLITRAAIKREKLHHRRG